MAQDFDGYRMTGAQVAKVAGLAGVTCERATELLLGTDWPNPAEHQKWLDTAPLAEIAAWVRDFER